MRREGRARVDIRREELLVLAQTERDVEDIRSGRKTLAADNRIVEPREQDDSLARRYDSDFRVAAASLYRNQIAREMRGEVNVSKALLKAEEDLEDCPQEPPPGRNVDDDWLFRWRDAASLVSAYELQTLWGRVLSGEIKSPGSCSFRTLEFLKNMSREEALQIANLSSFVIDNDFISCKDKKLLESFGITFERLHYLQDLGVISGVGALDIGQSSRSRVPDRFDRAFISHDRVLVVTHEDGEKKVKFDICPLTSLGKQVLKIGSFNSNKDYLRSVGLYIRSQGFKVIMARWKQLTETQGQYFDGEELDG